MARRSCVHSVPPSLPANKPILVFSHSKDYLYHPSLCLAARHGRHASSPARPFVVRRLAATITPPPAPAAPPGDEYPVANASTCSAKVGGTPSEPAEPPARAGRSAAVEARLASHN